MDHQQQIDASKVQYIVDTALSFWKSKVLLVAIDLGVFTQLAKAGMTSSALGDRLGLHERGRADFLDSLVALGFLARSGNDSEAVYYNTPESALLLNKDSPNYMGGVLEMTNARVYPFWGNLAEALKSGKPQNETKETGSGWYEALYADPAKLEQFMAAMAGYQISNFKLLVEKFDLSTYASFCDVGGASGALAIEVARAYPNIKCMTFDLPPVAPIATKRKTEAGLADRVEVVTGSFVSDPLPRADVISMGNILHNWSIDMRKTLIAKAYEALPEGGAFLAIEHLIDNERRSNVAAMLMSLNMLIETADGAESTGEQFDTWCKEAGFKRTEVLSISGGTSAAIAYK